MTVEYWEPVLGFDLLLVRRAVFCFPLLVGIREEDLMGLDKTVRPPAGHRHTTNNQPYKQKTTISRLPDRR